LKDEIVVTVIATGFDEAQIQQAMNAPRPKARPVEKETREPQQPATSERRREREELRRETPSPQQQQPRKQEEDTLDIPTFLRNRNRRK